MDLYRENFVKGKYHKLGKNILKSNNVLYLKFDKYVLENKKLLNKEDIKSCFSTQEPKMIYLKEVSLKNCFLVLEQRCIIENS